MRRRGQGLPSHFHQALARTLERAVEFPHGVLVTLVHGELTGDARFAKGVISVLPEHRGEEMLSLLKTSEPEIKRILNQHIRLRRMPNFSWQIDTTEVHAAELEKTIHELEQRGEL